MGNASPDAPETFVPRRRLHLPRGRRLHDVLSGRLGDFAAAVIADAVVALLFLPPVAFLAAGIWGLIAYARALYAAWGVLTHWQLDAFFGRLAAVDFAARVGLAGGAYYASLLALIVVFAGLFGRRARHWYLLPGVALALPAVALFLFAAATAHAAIAARLHLPGVVAPLLTAYALCDAVVLAALLLDMRPAARRRRWSWPLHSAPAMRRIPRLEVVPATVQPEAPPLALGTVGSVPSTLVDQAAQAPMAPGDPLPAPDAPPTSDGPAPGLTA